jgi:hypothetical protein
VGKPSSREKLGAWSVPSRGVIRTLPPQDLPKDALYSASNVLVQDGELRERPGFQRARNSQEETGLGIPTGAFLYRDGRDIPHVLVGTTSGLYVWSGVGWRSIAHTTLNGSLDFPNRFTILRIGSVTWATMSNGVDPPIQWDGSSTLTQEVIGLPVGPTDNPGDPKPPPRFTDLTTLGRRVIGIVPPYDVRWGNATSLSQWPELNAFPLADTPDPLVAIKALGTLGGAIYKRKSIWAVFFQGGSNASAFRMEIRGLYDGPCSPAAVVDVSGTHLYMTPTGRFASFNGSQHLWIADGLWPAIRDGFTDVQGRVVLAPVDTAQMRHAFGVYDARFHRVLFVYPRVGDEGFPGGLVWLTFPRPGTGADVVGGFPGSLSTLAQSRGANGGLGPLRLSCGLDYEFNDRVSHVGVWPHGTPKTVLNPEGRADLGQPFAFEAQTGLLPAPGLDMHRLDSVEPFLDRDTGYGKITFRAVRSYALDQPGGAWTEPQVIDLEQPHVRPIQPIDARGRFFGLRLESTPETSSENLAPPVPTLRFHGALAYGRPLELPVS